MDKIDDLTILSYLKLLTQKQKDKVIERLTGGTKVATIFLLHDLYDGYFSKDIYNQYKFSTKKDLAHKIINDHRNYQNNSINLISCDGDECCYCENCCCDFDCNKTTGINKYDCRCDCSCKDKLTNYIDKKNPYYSYDHYEFIRLFSYTSPLCKLWITYPFKNELINTNLQFLQDLIEDDESHPYSKSEISSHINKYLVDNIYKELGYATLIDHIVSIEEEEIDHCFGNRPDYYFKLSLTQKDTISNLCSHPKETKKLIF